MVHLFWPLMATSDCVGKKCWKECQAPPSFEECSEFLAGNLLRSKSRYKALDETGVIGISCRHEFPYRLFNLRHGERSD